MFCCFVERLLNIIDSYERQIFLLRSRVEKDVDLPSAASVDDKATPNFKALIRAKARCFPSYLGYQLPEPIHLWAFPNLLLLYIEYLNRLPILMLYQQEKPTNCGT